jgi:uncharacterized DUF497 family protein
LVDAGGEVSFEWDQANEEKLVLRHGVSAWEAEQCFFNECDVRICGQGTYLLMGRTDSGRMLLLVFERKPGHVVRIYSGAAPLQGPQAAFGMVASA